MSMVIEEASAKVRDSAPIDDEADYAIDCWAGLIPLRLQVGPAIDDPRLKPGIPTLKGLDHWTEDGTMPEILAALARRKEK